MSKKIACDARSWWFSRFQCGKIAVDALPDLYLLSHVVPSLMSFMERTEHGRSRCYKPRPVEDPHACGLRCAGCTQTQHPSAALSYFHTVPYSGIGPAHLSDMMNPCPSMKKKKLGQ